MSEHTPPEGQPVNAGSPPPPPPPSPAPIPPPPPPPVPGAVVPGANYATGTMAANDNGNGTAALVLGILGIIGCLPLLGSILAIVLGKSGMNKADQGRANNRGVAQAGFILGIVGLVLSVIGIILWFMFIAAASTTSSI